jgi:hypothetical protein
MTDDRAGTGARKSMIGIYDFSYTPYALGDSMTWTMNVNIGAVEAGLDVIDQYLVFHPRDPSNLYQRGLINPYNYLGVIADLFPAFLCSPMLRSLKLIFEPEGFNPEGFDLFLLREAIRRRPMWPSLFSHLNRKLHFTSHRRINAFYAKHRYLPWLAAPRGYGAWADVFRHTHCGGRFVVAVNIRQAALGPMPSALSRDSPLPEWYGFMRLVAERHPDVLFLALGNYTEWERTLYRLPNVLIPRAMGFGLGHELALLHRADMFMGSSSGFAEMAKFCNRPYVITHIEQAHSYASDVAVGGRHYLFGNENQILYWERETQEVLLDFFEEIHDRLRIASGS